MFPRKRFEISWWDLLTTLPRSWGSSASQLRHQIEAQWGQGGFVCLSVRTGLDLLLTALRLPAGSEIIVSALNVPDMWRILEAHQLVVVPVEVELGTASPALADIEAKITSKTRAVLVAQLFGGRCNLSALGDLCRIHDLQLWEDSAQGYCGPDYRGHPAADVSFFSFGSIKSATTLGGGVLTVKDLSLRNQLQDLRDEYPRQTHANFSGRLVKVACMKLLTTPLLYRIFVRLIEGLGHDLEQTLHKWVRGFPGDQLLASIRQRSSTPLLALLRHRLRHPPLKQLRQRQLRGNLLRSLLSSHVTVAGSEQHPQTHWVFPILVPHKEHLVKMLRQEGFDAAASATLAPHPQAPATTHSWQDVLYLPTDASMNEAQVQRLASAVRSHHLTHLLGYPIGAEAPSAEPFSHRSKAPST